MKFQKISKDELKALAKKYSPYIQAAVSIAAVGLAAYYMWKVKQAEDEIAKYETVDPHAWPSIEISPQAMVDIKNGATLLLRQFDIEPNHTVIQFSTGVDGFPLEADEQFSKYAKHMGTTTVEENNA